MPAESRQVVAGEYEERLALGEADRWPANGVGKDAVDAVVGYSLRRELPDHPAMANYVLEFHGADGLPGH